MNYCFAKIKWKNKAALKVLFMQFLTIDRSSKSKKSFNSFVPNASFLYHLFSGGRERVHWEQMGKFDGFMKRLSHEETSYSSSKLL